ncbi:hypothetical protein VB774_09525 [Pseudanabaena galeata UHCC 0370]|uniref:Uncharacterized protein n=1 Tax=Pseudanabaena galeata UHCC 0370 TaxID=3110310 RepID=A0ABU5THY7_9CYAN|nr:hypothetical protein [Pseudanabaena galeata]MEA5477860.1 hypothetical protein [Pseudanabaena galeata UHCC 0370]
MKVSSLFSIGAIAASTLITFSTSALATSQLQNITANSQLQSLQISELSIQKNDGVSKEEKEEEEESESNAGRCNPSHPLFPYCGWW